MGSMYAQLRKEKIIESINQSRIADFDETDPYYFVVYDQDKLIAEGDLPMMKLRLEDKYLYKPIKSFHKNKTTMVATIIF